LKDAALLERARCIMNPTMWFLGGSQKVRINGTRFANALIARGVDGVRAADVTRGAEAWVERLRTETSGEVVRWVAHGHRAWEFLWSGIAAVSAPYCASADVLDSIGCGHAALKMSCAADLLADKVSADGAYVFPGLWQSLPRYAA